MFESNQFRRKGVGAFPWSCDGMRRPHSEMVRQLQHATDWGGGAQGQNQEAGVFQNRGKASGVGRGLGDSAPA